MDEVTLSERIRRLVSAANVRVSDHGYDELATDGLTVRECVESIDSALVVEEYPVYPKGPCVLFLQTDARGMPIHVLWGIPKGAHSPAVLVTAYRPDAQRWEPDYRRRRR